MLQSVGLQRVGHKGVTEQQRFPRFLFSLSLAKDRMEKISHCPNQVSQLSWRVRMRGGCVYIFNVELPMFRCLSWELSHCLISGSLSP